MILRQVLPEQKDIDCDGLAGLRNVLQLVPVRRGVTMLNLVFDEQGHTTGKSGSSRDISNELDYQSLMALRNQADYIVTSAKTARVEKYRRSRMAPLVLLSESGNFDGIPAVVEADAGPQESPVFLVSQHHDSGDIAARYPQTWVRVIDYTQMVEKFASANFVVAETGLSLSKKLIASGLIQEIALSVVGVRADVKQVLNRALHSLGLGNPDPYYLASVQDTVFARFRDLKHHASQY